MMGVMCCMYEFSRARGCMWVRRGDAWPAIMCRDVGCVQQVASVARPPAVLCCSQHQLYGIILARVEAVLTLARAAHAFETFPGGQLLLLLAISMMS